MDAQPQEVIRLLATFFALAALAVPVFLLLTTWLYTHEHRHPRTRQH